ncbi:MAG TPA: type II toxin-antitoxin system HicB family antitoxin [Candidatus Hydrogenedentes bacterium]|nr:type II toxin-antitoxin system HicB family antitoxin [Candidatus Hydrogenedentota bacterium]HPG68649.1 type II toxin-antitoxin system HicB family antitoxin [Candidatus Hydrogenedentota bacterium]
MKQHQFTVVYERDEEGRVLAICPALQGCYTEGETEEEARASIREAIHAHIQSRLARGESISTELGVEAVSLAV